MALMRLNGNPFCRFQVWTLYWNNVLDGSKAKVRVPNRSNPNPSKNRRRKGRYLGSKAVTAILVSANAEPPLFLFPSEFPADLAQKLLNPLQFTADSVN